MIDKILSTKVASAVVAVWMAFHIFIALQGDLIWQVFATLSLLGVVTYTLDSASARKLLTVFGLGFLATTSEFLYYLSQGVAPGAEGMPPAPGMVLWVVATLWVLLAGTATYTGLVKSET
tara:strand:+ start:1258 stop:1617 length:360 start_codon:yes stop_codon:yes gene_type:complete